MRVCLLLVPTFAALSCALKTPFGNLFPDTVDYEANEAVQGHVKWVKHVSRANTSFHCKQSPNMLAQLGGGIYHARISVGVALMARDRSYFPEGASVAQKKTIRRVRNQSGPDGFQMLNATALAILEKRYFGELKVMQRIQVTTKTVSKTHSRFLVHEMTHLAPNFARANEKYRQVENIEDHEYGRYECQELARNATHHHLAVMNADTYSFYVFDLFLGSQYGFEAIPPPEQEFDDGLTRKLLEKYERNDAPLDSEVTRRVEIMTHDEELYDLETKCAQVKRGIDPSGETDEEEDLLGEHDEL